MAELVYCVAFSSRGFLMVHNAGRSGWEFPGGHVEPGEDPRGAAIREFREETGLDLDIVRAVHDERNRAVIFFGRVEGVPGPVTDGAIDEVRHFTTPPEKLAFGLEECLTLLEMGARILGSPGNGQGPRSTSECEKE